MRLLTLILCFFLFFQSCKTVKHVISTAINVDSINYTNTAIITSQQIDTTKCSIVKDSFDKEVVIEYRQDTITHLPVVTKKTIKSKGVKTITKKDNNLFTTITNVDSTDSDRVVTNQQIDTKDVTRTNYTSWFIIAGIIVAIVVVIKIIKR